MKIWIAVAFIVASIALFGCSSPTAANTARIANRNAEASGSAFRWKTESVRGGTMMIRVLADLPRGASRADPTLKRDILRRIQTVETSKQRSDPEVEDVRFLADGREVWILKYPQKGIAYIVRMTPSLQGGTDFSIEGPHEFTRNG